jgi:hypothetical protein
MKEKNNRKREKFEHSNSSATRINENEKREESIKLVGIESFDAYTGEEK